MWILDINEPTEFFKTVDKKRDDLLDDAEDTAPVFDFFKGDQRTIFEEAVKNLAYFGNRIIFEQLHSGHPWNALENDEFLMKLRAAAKNKDGTLSPTIAGLLFFGEANHIKKIFQIIRLSSHSSR